MARGILMMVSCGSRHIVANAVAGSGDRMPGQGTGQKKHGQDSQKQ
jgi:hypothetical protein